MGREVTFQILDGVDKGRIFKGLPTPLTVGREEGNALRLNDERVSRFHAKVQIDNEDFIITDLESTNGTRVNGIIVQIRRLRFGDRINVGRSLLLFGSNEEIAARIQNLNQGPNQTVGPQTNAKKPEEGKTLQSTMPGQIDSNYEFELNMEGKTISTREALFIGQRALPPLPLKITPSQSARFAEILDFLHQGITEATEFIQAKDDGTQVNIPYAEWQKILALQMLLARYQRIIAEPAD